MTAPIIINSLPLLLGHLLSCIEAIARVYYCNILFFVYDLRRKENSPLPWSIYESHAFCCHAFFVFLACLILKDVHSRRYRDQRSRYICVIINCTQKETKRKHSIVCCAPTAVVEIMNLVDLHFTHVLDFQLIILVRSINYNMVCKCLHLCNTAITHNVHSKCKNVRNEDNKKLWGGALLY